MRAVLAVVFGAAAVLWLGTAAARSGQAALRSTSTSVSCQVTIVVGQAVPCTATVSDTDSGTITTPTGTVDFSASSIGSFPDPASCTLSEGSCQITFTGTALGQATVAAAYNGDSSHATSSGTQEIEVTGPSPGPPFCKVPRVTGKTLAQALRTIQHSRCRPGRISHSYSKRIRTGRVISQRPKAGKVLGPAAWRTHKVHLVVSRGKRP